MGRMVDREDASVKRTAGQPTSVRVVGTLGSCDRFAANRLPQTCRVAADSPPFELNWTTSMTERLSSVDAAATLLRGGGLVAFGTETVYGLGANAIDVKAVARIFAAKGRPKFDPLIVHLASRETVSKVARNWTAAEDALAAAFWPGPLTIVTEKQPQVPDLVTSGLSTVGVRVPAPDQTRELLRLANTPVAAPSANLFGRVSPTTADHVLDQLSGRIDAVLDCGPCAVGLESTVVRLRDDVCEILRPGGVTADELRRVCGDVRTAVDAERGEM